MRTGARRRRSARHARRGRPTPPLPQASIRCFESVELPEVDRTSGGPHGDITAGRRGPPCRHSPSGHLRSRGIDACRAGPLPAGPHPAGRRPARRAGGVAAALQGPLRLGQQRLGPACPGRCRTRCSHSCHRAGSNHRTCPRPLPLDCRRRSLCGRPDRRRPRLHLGGQLLRPVGCGLDHFDFFPCPRRPDELLGTSHRSRTDDCECYGASVLLIFSI